LMTKVCVLYCQILLYCHFKWTRKAALIKVRVKNGWLWSRIMCPSWTTWLPNSFIIFTCPTATPVLLVLGFQQVG
jgi:hypothetical protein